jgi:hypothetical protein
MPRRVPAFLDALVDDAAIFPPGNVPLDQAVKEHREPPRAPYAALVGGFVVSDTRLADLAALATRPRPLDLNVVVTAGPVRSSRRSAGREADGLRLARSRSRCATEDDLARNATRAWRMVDNLRSEMGDDVEVYVEPPRRTLVARPGLAGRARRDLDGRPPAQVPHRWRHRRRRSRPCRAGVEHRRGARPGDAVQVHGRAARRGPAHRPRDRVRAPRLPERPARDPRRAGRGRHRGGAVVGRTGHPAARPEACASARRWFTSFGSCSVLDVHEDLVDLELWKDEA